MRYILKYFKPSKYMNYKRKEYVEFETISYLLTFIFDNDIKDFKIYEKNIILESGIKKFTNNKKNDNIK